MEKNMKTIEETLKEIERRFAFNQTQNEWWLKQSEQEMEYHHIKKSKECEDTANEYNDRNYELIMLYSYITGESWLDACRFLHDNARELKRNAE